MSADGDDGGGTVDRGRLAGIRGWFDRNKRTAAVGAIAAGGYFQFIGGWPNVSPALVAVVAVVAAAVGGALFAFRRLVDLLYRDQWVYLMDVDARDRDVAVYRLNPEAFGELTVLNGELFEADARYPVRFCRHYRPQENVCEGTWRGSVSDLELIQERERIDAVRNELEEWGRQGLETRMKLPDIVRSALRSISTDMVRGYEDMTVYSGERIEEAVTSALSEYELPDEDGEDDTPSEWDQSGFRSKDAGGPETSNGHENGGGEIEVTPDG